MPFQHVGVCVYICMCVSGCYVRPSLQRILFICTCTNSFAAEMNPRQFFSFYLFTLSFQSCFIYLFLVYFSAFDIL